jgi:hypothetical protein
VAYRCSKAALRVQAVMLVLLAAGCAPRTTTVETTTVAVPGGGTVTERQRTVDNRTIETLRATWETEYLEAVGTAVVVDRYPEPARNRELARRGAVADARARLAAMISAVRVDETTTMADLETSNMVRTSVTALIHDSEILSEAFSEAAGRWEVRVRMPKVRLLRVLESQSRE